MPENADKSPARPFFRKLAIVVSITCFILAAVISLAPATREERLLAALSCLAVGFVMLVIGRSGPGKS